MGQVSLTRGFVATVDDRDECWLSEAKWQAEVRHSGIVYASRDVRADGLRTHIPMHKVVWERHSGPVPDGFTVDHRNRDGLDNRLENLRLATHQQQKMNRGPARGSSSQFKGVTWKADSSKWEVQIQIDGKSRYLGHFSTEEQAAVAYDTAAFEEFGEFAYLNFP